MPPEHRDMIVVGASAGGVEALRSLVGGIPGDLAAAVAVVLHLPAGGTSALPEILRRFGSLPATTPASGTPALPGRVYVAPPDHHLLVVGDQLVLSHGPAENGHRPAVNALFRSAAVSMGRRVIGVILSGVLDDGAAGLVAIKSRGGLAVVQDPADALYSGMPDNALRYVRADHVLPASDIGPLLAELTRENTEPPPVSAMPGPGNEIAQDRRTAVDHEANGVGAPAWTAEALRQAQGDVFERALWTALRSLDEKARLARRMHREAIRRGSDRLATRYGDMAQEATEAAEVLRGRLTAMPTQIRVETEP